MLGIACRPWQEAFSTGASFSSFVVGVLVVPGAAGGIITGGMTHTC